MPITSQEPDEDGLGTDTVKTTTNDDSNERDQRQEWPPLRRSSRVRAVPHRLGY